MPATEDVYPLNLTIALRYTYPEALAWIAAALADNVAGMSHKPGLSKNEPVPGRSPLDTSIRKLFEANVRETRQKLQVKAWARAKANPRDQDLSFSRACKNNGWTESTATNNVNRALGVLFILMNGQDRTA